jgi:hypothetical protein
MAKKMMAVVITTCTHCNEIIEVSADEISDDGYWQEPMVGGSISGDTIKSVRKYISPRSSVPVYLVSINTMKPHCGTK